MAETITLDALCRDIKTIFCSYSKKEGIKGRNHYKLSDERCTSFNFSDPTKNYSVIIDVRKMDRHPYKEEPIEREAGEQTAGIELQIEGKRQIGENINSEKIVACTNELVRYMEKLSLDGIRYTSHKVCYHYGTVGVYRLQLFAKEGVTPKQFADEVFKLQKMVGEILIKYQKFPPVSK